MRCTMKRSIITVSMLRSDTGRGHCAFAKVSEATFELNYRNEFNVGNTLPFFLFLQLSCYEFDESLQVSTGSRMFNMPIVQEREYL